MNTRRLKFALLFLLADVSFSTSDIEPSRIEYARVDWHQVSAPFGKFLLMRGAEGVCAVRFTDYHLGQDAKAPTMFNSGEETASAEYEWHFVAAGTGWFSSANVTHGKSRVSTGPLKGIGRLAFQSKNPILKCGPLKTFWLKPSSLSFSDQINCKGAKLELAPTRWNILSDVNVADERLKWFKCDEDRKTFQIPVSEL